MTCRHLLVLEKKSIINKKKRRNVYNMEYSMRFEMRKFACETLSQIVFFLINEAFLYSI